MYTVKLTRPTKKAKIRSSLDFLSSSNAKLKLSLRPDVTTVIRLSQKYRYTSSTNLQFSNNAMATVSVYECVS